METKSFQVEVTFNPLGANLKNVQTLSNNSLAVVKGFFEFDHLGGWCLND